MNRTSFLSLLSKADRVDGRPGDSNEIEEFIDFYVQFGSCVLERVVKNRPSLPWYTLRLRALGHRPLVTGSVDADGVGGKAVEVRDSPGVGLREDIFRNVLGGILHIETSGCAARLRGRQPTDFCLFGLVCPRQNLFSRWIFRQ